MFSAAATRRRSAALIAALALLLAQAIGLAHGVAHPQANGAAVAGETHDHAFSAFDAQHEEGSWQCQLLDQLSHVDGLAASSHGRTFAAPVAAFTVSPAAPLHATCARGYHARGPPIFLA
jgi:hypothetical protein